MSYFFKIAQKELLEVTVGVTNGRPSSNYELISRMEMRLLACVTRDPSREPYRKHGLFHIDFILGILRTDLWSQGTSNTE